MERGLVILKIGGSVITQKDKPLTPRQSGIQTAAEAVSEFGKPMVIVHGAGSFGHFLAKRHGLSKLPVKAKPEVVSEIRAAVLKLSSLVVEAIQSKGVSLYWLQPYALYSSRKKEHWKPLLMSLIQHRISPLSYGDVIPADFGFRIISGDEIVRDLAGLLKPERVVFAIDVDGIYRYDGNNKQQIEELSMEEARNLAFDPVKIDATGGMRGKLDEAITIASMGIDVHFTNGLRKQRLVKALKGKDPQGTLVKGKVFA